MQFLVFSYLTGNIYAGGWVLLVVVVVVVVGADSGEIPGAQPSIVPPCLLIETGSSCLGSLLHRATPVRRAFIGRRSYR